MITVKDVGTITDVLIEGYKREIEIIRHLSELRGNSPLEDMRSARGVLFKIAEEIWYDGLPMKTKDKMREMYPGMELGNNPVVHIIKKKLGED